MEAIIDDCEKTAEAPGAWTQAVSPAPRASKFSQNVMNLVCSYPGSPGTGSGRSWLEVFYRPYGAPIANVFTTNQSTVQVPETPDLAGRMKDIIKTFKGSVPELGRLFGVSRQSIYKWGREKVGSLEHRRDLIVALAEAAETFRAEGVVPDAMMMGMRIRDGKTFFELVDEDVSNVELAHVLARFYKQGKQQSKRMNEFTERHAIRKLNYDNETPHTIAQDCPSK